MIVYNVKRRFFAKKDDADAYRRELGLKPAELNRVEVWSRDELAALLTALAEPTAANIAAVASTLREGPLAVTVAPEAVIDNAYIPTDRDVPKFLRESWAKMGRA